MQHLENIWKHNYIQPNSDPSASLFWSPKWGDQSQLELLYAHTIIYFSAIKEVDIL